MLLLVWLPLISGDIVSGTKPQNSFICGCPADNAAGGGKPTRTLTLDPSTGLYTLHLGDSSTLPSAPYRLFHDGQWLNSTKGEGLELQSPAISRSGNDQHGEWSAIELHWHLAAVRVAAALHVAPPRTWVTSFRCYNHSGMVVFTQTFPNGLGNAKSPSLSETDSEERSIDRPSTAFPSFGMPRTALGMVTFQGQNAAPTTQVGTWPDATRGGYDGGPFAVFTKDLQEGIVVLSPLTHFMSVLHAKLFEDDALSFGLGGLLNNVPTGFSVDFVASVGYPHNPSQSPESGNQFAGLMARAWMKWGDVLLQQYNQQRTRPDASPWISQLGYSTTGVFHYNPCDCQGNKNTSYCVDDNNPLMPSCHTYEDTLLQVHDYAQSVGIPYRWWCVNSGPNIFIPI
eukprot:COSAG02_NODE_5830_length_4005_cov_12.669483_3_plen_398_part_00